MENNADFKSENSVLDTITKYRQQANLLYMLYAYTINTTEIDANLVSV